MVIYLLRGGNLGYYLIITFVFFVLVDYKYIYSYIDSKFLYTTSGSKLSKETNSKNENTPLFVTHIRYNNEKGA